MDLSPYCKGGSVIPVNLDKLKGEERIYDPRRSEIQILGIMSRDVWIYAHVGWRLIVLENTCHVNLCIVAVWRGTRLLSRTLAAARIQRFILVKGFYTDS